MLAGVFQAGWGYAVVGAIAIVLAAMYMLRLISAVLHREVGSAVSDAALDLRSAELAILVPLVAILFFLSAWPARDHRALVRRPPSQTRDASTGRPGSPLDRRLDVLPAAMLMRSTRRASTGSRSRRSSR